MNTSYVFICLHAYTFVQTCICIQTHTSDTREQLYKQRNGAAPDEEPFRTPYV